MKRKVVLTGSAVLLIAAAASAFSVVQTLKSPPRLFRRNAELKADGFYMGEFEFKMMATLYHLNDGAYWSAYQGLRRINHEMQTLDGLSRMPRGASPEQLMKFMLERQNPETGAFMDPSFPLVSYIGPTANALDYLDLLSRQTGRPVKLKYRLSFLDQIADPERLRATLGSTLYFREFWADKFGGPTPFVLVSELSPESIELFERVGGYRFPEGWKQALRDWFYEAQDPATGFWGGRIGEEGRWRQSLDIDSTSHILKHFLTDEGELRDPKYPLRYAEPLARTLLKEADKPVPDDAVEQHEWSLRQFHAAKIIVRWLWPDLSDSLREQALQAMSRWVAYRFSLYRPEQGGFAVDASSSRADIDATSTSISFLKQIGSIPGTWERERLRGKALAAGLGKTKTSVIVLGTGVASFPGIPGLNSVRVYRDSAPSADSWDDSRLLGIFYPTDTQILDIMDLRQRLVRFLAAEGGEYGNWSSKAELREGPLGLGTRIGQVPVARGWPNLSAIASDNPRSARFIVVGLDAFQVPEYEVEVRRTFP
ncbi:MAG: hypothetical protein EHM61_20055 [Acidobacteria bacterium]|nr:MAG: hypothetical protein EHM61_20055 [Acidobacteriota bacterium]